MNLFQSQLANFKIKLKFFACLTLLFFNLLSAQQNDLEIIKSRIYNSILSQYSGIPYDSPEKVYDDKILEKILADFDGEKWPYIHYSDVSREGFDNGIHLKNLLRMAVAFKSPTSKYFENQSLLTQVINGLRFWCENDFFGENWWDNQIGTPWSMVELMLVIGEKLPKKLVSDAQVMIQRANINKGGARPGGDRIKVSSIAAKNQLFLGNSKQFDLIINIIENEIKFVDWIGADFGYTFSKSDTGGFNEFSKANGRGLQYDYSFHHRTDGVNNTLSYGLGWARAFVEWAYYTRNTDYAFSLEKTKILVDYYLDGVCKTSVFGIKSDFGAKNRSISRQGATKPFDNVVTRKLISLTNYREGEMREIIKLRDEGNNGTASAHATFYWNSEHFAFQRPQFYTSVRLYSSRNMNMESPYNSEGLLNHHRGDGANHIYTHGAEYDDISPVLDYQRIAGTTAVQKESLPHHNQIKKLGLTDFVGAATNGKYGVVGFDFKSIHDPMVARKSWFFFDEQYLCLGSGISTKSKNEVNTTLNQSLLNGVVHVSSLGKAQKLEKGSHQLVNIDWIHHDNTAYFFPISQKVSLQNDEVTGTWWRINKQIDSSKEEIRKGVFKTWINHGESPDNASYQYFVRPNTSLEKLLVGEVNNRIQILSNTPYLQAAIHTHLKLVQAVFYRAGQLEVGAGLKVQATAPCILLIKMDSEDKILQITASDPNRELSSLLLKVNKKFEGSSKSFRSYWNTDDGWSEIIINLPQNGYAGQSVVIP